jgi:sugar lactone lactonase YvrE
MRTWDVAVQEQVDLGEAPFWNDERQCLWFVDITGGVLHRFDPRTGAIGGQLVGSPLSAAIAAVDGGLVVTRANGVYRYDWDHGRAELIAAHRTTRCNDPAQRCGV